MGTLDSSVILRHVWDPQLYMGDNEEVCSQDHNPFVVVNVFVV